MVSIQWSGNALHQNVLRADPVDGGYEVTTTGASATVHMNHDLEKATMDSVGAYTIEGDLPTVSNDDDEPVETENGYKGIASRWVELEHDGSLKVNAMGVDGGFISTALWHTKDGLEVEVQADGLKLRGESPVVVPNA